MATGKSKRGKKTSGSKKRPVVARHRKDRRNPDEQEERHNVLCQCGWGRLNCPVSEIPENCPICGDALLRENPGEDPFSSEEQQRVVDGIREDIRLHRVTPKQLENEWREIDAQLRWHGRGGAPLPSAATFNRFWAIEALAPELRLSLWRKNPGVEELVDVRCRCGWELPGCPASNLPVECPECAAAFSEEIVENPGADYNSGEPGSLPNGEPRSPRGRERARLEREERERLGKTNICPGCQSPCGTLHPLGRPEDGTEPWMVCGRCKREWEEAPGLSCRAPGSKHHPGSTCGGMLVYRWDAPSQSERLVCAVCGNVQLSTPRQKNPRWVCEWCSRPSKGGNRLCDRCVEHAKANPGHLSSCEGCGRATTAGYGLCSACSSVGHRNPRERRVIPHGQTTPRNFTVRPGGYQSKTQQDRELSRTLRERRRREFDLLAESGRPRAYPVSIDWEDIEMPPTFAPGPDITELRRGAAIRAAEDRRVRPVSIDWEDIEMPPTFAPRRPNGRRVELPRSTRGWWRP